MWECEIRRYDFLHHIDGEVVVFGILSRFLFGFAMIVCCGGSLMLALAIYQNKHLTKQLEQKE